MRWAPQSWKPWWAWRPVKINVANDKLSEIGTVVWGEWIERRRRRLTDYTSADWLYRLPDKKEGA